MIPLGDDILSFICWHLCPSANASDPENADRRKTLYRLMRVSWSLYHAARPVLYHTLDLTADDEAGQRILKNCLERPETTSFVRAMLLKDHISSPEPYEISFDDIPLFLDATRNVDISADLRRNLRQAFRSGIRNAPACLILYLCKDVRTIEYLVDCSEVSVTQQLIDEVVNRPVLEEATSDTSAWSAPRFQNVKEVLLRHWKHENGIFLVQHSCFLKFPSLELFRGTEVVCSREDDQIPKTFRTKVRNIHLENSSVDMSGLRKILTACPDLRNLEIIWASSLGRHYVAEINPRGLGRVLRKYGQKLEFLHLQPDRISTWAIKDDDDEDEEFDEGFTGIQLGSLKRLTMLRDLCLPYDLLYDYIIAECKENGYLADVLPTSLQKFKIPLAAGGTDSQIQEFCEMLHAQLQVLMESEAFKALRWIKVGRCLKFLGELPTGWRVSHFDNKSIPHMLLKRVGET